MIIHKEALSADTYIEDKNELIYERKEVDGLKKQFMNYFSGKEPAFLKLISGPSGSGKTLSIRYILVNIFKEQPDYSGDFIYVNGADMRTPRSMFQYILNQMGDTSTSKEDVASILTKIKKRLNDKKRRTIFILDEVDKIYRGSRESPKWLFLHSLNRLETKPRHAILLVTNDFNLIKNFKPELTANMIESIFEAYTAEDIFKILKLRAKYCLTKGGYNEEELQKIAREAYKNPIGGDFANIRHALNILLNAAILAQERNTKLGSTVEEAITNARISDLTTLLKKYNSHLLLLIKALAQLKKKKSTGLHQYYIYGPNINLEDIKRTFYELLEEEGIKPLSERQIYNYILQLTEEHLLTRINRSMYCFTETADDILSAIATLNKTK